MRISFALQVILTCKYSPINIDWQKCDCISGIEQTNEEISDLKSQLLATKAEMDSLRGQLENTRGHADQYKTIADTLQQTIKEQNEVHTLLNQLKKMV